MSDYYKLEKLDPGYEVYFDNQTSIKIGDSLEKIYAAFEEEEKGSSVPLKRFIEKAADNYDIAIKVWFTVPELPLELVTPATIKKIGYFLSTIKKEVLKEFSNPRLAQILQFLFVFKRKTQSNTCLL